MPPHDPEVITYTYTPGPLGNYVTTTQSATTNFDEITASPNVHTTTNNPYRHWVLDSSDYWSSNTLNVSATDLMLDTELLGKKVRIALDEVLDQYFRRLYEIINDVHNFSISEDEFMKLLKED